MAKGFNDLPAPVQALILIVVAVGAAGGLFWYFVLPLSARRDGLDKEVTKLKAENQKNQVFEQQRTRYLADIADLEKQLETLRSIVPDEAATDEFMKMIFDDAGGTTVNVRTFIAQPLMQRDFYVEMPFSIRIDGTYWAMLSFFERLAHEQRIVSVTNLSMGGPSGGGMGAYTVLPSETVGANCILTTYFNRPQPAAQAKKK